MPKKVDLTIPEPRLCPGYREYTSTRVPWLPGFDGNVHFKPWPEFDGVVETAGSAIDLLLSKKDLEDAAHHLGSSRKQACPRRLATDGMNVDARPVFTDCTSVMPIMSSMFSGIAEIVQLLKHTRKFAMVTKRVWLGRPTELPKDIRFKGKDGKKDKNGPPSKERVPDYTLMRLSTLNDIVGEPICAFELKGPGLDILGTPHSWTNITETGVSSAREDVQVLSTGPDNERQEQTQGSQSTGKTVTAEKLCKCFNELLGGESGKSRKGRGSGEEPKATARKPLVQALSYALSVKSGCVFLFNYLVGFAMQVVREVRNGGSSDERSEEQSPHDEKGCGDGSGAENLKKLIVRVSNPLFFDEDPGPLDGIIATALFSIALVDEDEDLPEYIQRLADFIDEKSREEGPPEDTDNTEKRETGSKRGISFDAKTQNESGKRSKQAKLADEVSLSSSEQRSEEWLKGKADHTLRTNTVNIPERTGVDLRAGTLPEFVSGCTEKLDVSKGGEASDSDDMTFSNCTSVAGMDLQSARKLPRLGVIGHGRSGNIIQSKWNGRKLAIKEWNGIDEEGRTDLMHETSILNSVMEVSPSLLGSVIPHVFISWSPPSESSEEEPIIVMEYVGKSIFEDQSGNFFIGDELNRSTAVSIGASDRIEIGKGALQGLQALHENGFVHGDIAIRNLRVQKISNGNEKKWSVWWLDFGHARRVRRDRPLRSFSRELEDRASLFGMEMGAQ